MTDITGFFLRTQSLLALLGDELLAQAEPGPDPEPDNNGFIDVAEPEFSDDELADAETASYESSAGNSNEDLE
ncbi:hypothetical protein [Candidatus Ichthyocystis sparus]|uniref:hypothetical protein n=1 Tax=Candidatus Ichthyocystis sparus TaxID=1561004 RepID=UPI000B85F782|nr:hypothetical protein [Candidatus Ichthyocystis sparus]